jgi:hypothetical protein
MLDVLKTLVKDNMKERSDLFVIHRETLDKINIKTTIDALSTRLTTYLAPRTLIPPEKLAGASTKKLDSKKNRKESLRLRGLQAESAESTRGTGKEPLVLGGVY